MYTIIRFTPQSKWYFPKSLDLGILEDTKDYVDHTIINISPEDSRIGGPIIDWPDSLDFPGSMDFVAQLNLSQFSPLDPFNLLPKSGFLYFFLGGDGQFGKVLFADVARNQLQRIIREHNQWFFDGCIINKIFNEDENFDSRFCEENEDFFDDEEDSIQWNYGAGSEKSKIFGIYTHCQKDEEEIREITNSDNILLLQIGEDFTSEGVLSVLIKEADIKKRDFQHCQFEWGQS